MQLQQNVKPMVQWVLLAFILFGLFGCSSVAMNFKSATGTRDQFDIKVFQGTFSSKSDESVIESKAKEFASQMGYTSFEILPEHSSGYGQPIESDNGQLVFSLIGAAPQRYNLYAVKFKR